MKATAILFAGVAGLALAGCGESTGERALSGGAIGAGAGAATSVITGGSLLGGAALGGLTDREDLDLDGDDDD